MSAPTGWTADPDELLEHYYWSGKPNSVKDVLKRYYDLHDAKPIWARDPKFGAVLIIFEATPGKVIKKDFYVWNGIESTTFHFKGNWTQDTLRKKIEEHRDEDGSLRKLDLEEVLPTA